jgi:hypothetical protein
MTTDPDQIRLEIAALLTDLPAPDDPDADVEAIAARLEEAHDLLVDALESVERGSASGSTAAPDHER